MRRPNSQIHTQPFCNIYIRRGAVVYFGGRFRHVQREYAIGSLSKSETQPQRSTALDDYWQRVPRDEPHSMTVSRIVDEICNSME
jgi:hypothetical protein